MKKLLKWICFTVVFIALLLAGVLAVAYWNRDTLLTRLTTELNKGINGSVYIDKINFTFLHDFPNFSITLNDVYLRDDQYEKYRQDIFVAKKIFLDVALYPLWKKEIVVSALQIDQAEVFIFKAMNGYTNTDIFKNSSDSMSVQQDKIENSFLLNLKNFTLKNVSVLFIDSTKEKSISFRFLETKQALAKTESGYSLNIKGPTYFDSLFFNPKGGAYLYNKEAMVNLHLHLNQKDETLSILPSSLQYKRNDIQITGKFAMEKGGPFNIRFVCAAVYPEEAKTLLTPKLINTLSKYKIDDAISIDVTVAGESIPGNIPSVDISFETFQATLKYGTLDFSNLTLRGTFTNHVDSTKRKDNNNSKVNVSSFDGIMEKLPVKGNVVFTTLQDPTIKLAFSSKMSAKDLNSHLDNDRFILTKGTFNTSVSYYGKLSEYLDPTRTKYNGSLKGKINARQASLTYKPKKIQLNGINLTCTFNEKIFSIDALKLDVNGSPVTVEGTMQNFIPFFVQPKNKGRVKLRVTSPGFDLTSLTSKRDQRKKSDKRTKADRKKVTDLLDRVYDKLEFDIDLLMKEFKFRKFSAHNFQGRVRLDNNILQANPVAMDVAGGTMHLNFSLKQLYNPVSPMIVEARLNQANIKTLFQHFNNFNQKTIIAENLSGNIFADVKFAADVDDTYTLLTPTMRGTLDCKITNGGLKDFEPMENMSNFLFKKRDFSDVQFAELNSAFTINGTNMDISRMEIQSTVLSLFLEGRYSFTDSTSLSVQLPLSNLKKRHKDFKPKNIGTHAKAGPSIFLHVYRDKDINSKIKIDYDPFKKWVVSKQ